MHQPSYCLIHEILRVEKCYQCIKSAEIYYYMGFIGRILDVDS
jgi:hypothetical protein